MKANKKFMEGEEEAVSAVIGVILMVAITVAIAATVYVYVSGMIGGTATKTSTLSMNTFSFDDGNQQRVWLVSGIEGESVDDTSYSWALLNSTGANATGATCTFNEIKDPGHINPGDTFTVIAPSDGYYVFILTYTITGQRIYKSSMSKY